MRSHMSKSSGETSAANVINNLQFDVDLLTLSFDSRREVTERLLEMDPQVVKVILDCKKDIWKNQELSEFVETYFENSLKVLDFCTALKERLESARGTQLIILQQFDEEDDAEGNGRYSRTLDELNSFKDAGDPFTEEFFPIFESVFGQQKLMLERSQLEKNKQDKELKYIHAGRKVSSIFFASTLAAGLICSVVAAAMAAPRVAAALAAGTSVPLGSIWSWTDSLLKNHKYAVKAQQEIINYMNAETRVTSKHLGNISLLLPGLRNEIKSLLKSAVEEIKQKLATFMTNIEELEAQADKCSQGIRRAGANTLGKIIKYPNH